MKRVRRLHELWSWLPAFRAVAETEHLPSAAKNLTVSPSALSRSIRLLEEAVGQPLFDRVGRNLELNEAGKIFLLSVRDAMRLVDEGLAAVGDGQLVGPVIVSVPGPFAAEFVLPALATVTAEHPGLTPVIRSEATSDIVASLRQGTIDLALTDDEIHAEDLEIEALCRITHGVYCGDGHPLRGARAPTLDEITACGFAAPVPDARGIEHDAWPSHRRRTVVLRVTQMVVAIAACKRGDVVTVLPDVVGEHHGLHRVAFDELASTTLYAVRRPPLPLGGRAEVVADAIREFVQVAP